MNAATKNRFYFLILFVLFALCFLIDTFKGYSFFVSELSSSELFLINQFRLPKAITAVITGAGLSLAGLLLQGLFRNPLVGPYVLGISSGASLGVSLFIVTGSSFTGFVLAEFGLSMAAILGSVLMLMLILFFSRFLSGKVSLLLVGLMIGQLAGALQSLLDFLANPNELKSVLLWNMGSLENVGWDKQSYFLPITCVLICVSVLLIKPLDALLLGDDYATNLGVRVKRIRFFLLAISGTLTGMITAMCGPIAFVGIAVPHICRLLFSTSRHVILMPAVLLCGSLFMLLSDILSNFSNEFHLPVNVITSLIGVPVIIALIVKTRNLY